MAIKFNNLKDPKLGMLDTITFGKLKDCRVCDVIEDHYEYLIWIEKNGYVKFHQEVLDVIMEQANFERWEPPIIQPEATDTYLRKLHGGYTFDDSWDDDIPF